MSKRTLTLILALILIGGSIGLAALNANQLQGAFNFTGLSSSVLKVSAGSSDTTEIDWGSDSSSTLGVWKLKPSQNITIKGFGLNMGAPTSAGTENANAVGNFFKSCNLVLARTGNTETVSASDCNFAYRELVLESGVSYTLSLTGFPVETAGVSFYQSGYDLQQVALSFLTLTKADGTVLHYYDSVMASAIAQSSSVSVKDSSSVTYTLGYTKSGTTLDAPAAISSSSSSSNSSNLNPTQAGTNLEPEAAHISNGMTSIPSQNPSTLQALTQKIGVSIDNADAVTKPLTISISSGGGTIKISNGSSTKTCTLAGSGNYSCDIP